MRELIAENEQRNQGNACADPDKNRSDGAFVTVQRDTEGDAKRSDENHNGGPASPAYRAVP